MIKDGFIPFGPYRTYYRIVGKPSDKAPFSGLGKPEPLQHDLQGYDLQGFWSKKINDEHRMVYAVTETAIQIIQLKYHYHK